MDGAHYLRTVQAALLLHLEILVFWFDMWCCAFLIKTSWILTLLLLLFYVLYVMLHKARVNQTAFIVDSIVPLIVLFPFPSSPQCWRQHRLPLKKAPSGQTHISTQQVTWDHPLPWRTDAVALQRWDRGHRHGSQSLSIQQPIMRSFNAPLPGDQRPKGPIPIRYSMRPERSHLRAVSPTPTGPCHESHFPEPK